MIPTGTSDPTYPSCDLFCVSSQRSARCNQYPDTFSNPQKLNFILFISDAPISFILQRGQLYLLRGLPPPGVRDDRKRALVTLAASGAESHRVEQARMDLLVAPVAERRPHKVASDLTGDVREDPYYWLRDDDRKDKDMVKYIEAEVRNHSTQNENC